MKIKSFWYKSKNVGDTLTPTIVKHFTGKEVEYCERNGRNKLLAVGSIMKALRLGDTVWGAGVMRASDKFFNAHGCEFLAVRGKLSEKILGVNVGVYGDPALLLPLIYNPKIEKIHRAGAIPHYVDVDEPVFKELKEDGYFMIDVMQDWKSFIDQVLSCKAIVSSSLHGIIIAEAYGIPATWVKPSTKVLGDGFKFGDYLTGTGRKSMFSGGRFPPITNLPVIQERLITALQKKYGK